MDTYISWSDLPRLLNSYPNLGSISNSLQSDLLFDWVNFGLKLSNLFRYELFQLFMLFLTINPSIFALILSFSDLICHSPLCFGSIQGTALMLLARSGATAWTLLAARGATAWVLLSRSGARLEPLCQDPSSTVPGRPCSKTSFFSFFAKNWVCLLSALHCQACVLESDAYGLKFCGKRLVWLKNSKSRLGLLIVHFLSCLLVVFVKGFLFRKLRC